MKLWGSETQIRAVQVAAEVGGTVSQEEVMKVMKVSSTEGGSGTKVVEFQEMSSAPC